VRLAPAGHVSDRRYLDGVAIVIPLRRVTSHLAARRTASTGRGVIATPLDRPDQLTEGGVADLPLQQHFTRSC